MRTLAQRQGFTLAQIDDVDEALEIAQRGASLPAAELRAIADALSAGGAAVRVDSRSPRCRAGAARPSRRRFARCPRSSRASPTRSTNAAPCSIALRRRSRACGARSRSAQDDARDRTAALTRSAKYARAIQDAIVTMRNGRYVVPVKAEFAGEFPGIVHDTSATRRRRCSSSRSKRSRRTIACARCARKKNTKSRASSPS